VDRATAIKNAYEYAAEVRKVFDPFSIVLYGSYAGGAPTPESDIDIAVVFDDYEGDWLKDSATLWELTINISTLIEPILLDRAKDPSGFVEGIFKSGEILYQAG